jgi:hypothetical protein
MYIIMGHTIELMATINEEYVNELVNTATQKENIFWLKDGDGKPTTPYLKLEEFDVERFNEKGI